MINEKYYNDIKTFPEQFEKGFEIASDVKVEGDFDNVVVCGMGGSALYIDIINDFLAGDTDIDLRLIPNRTYQLPKNVNKKTLFFMISYSGNTEETLSCMKEAEEKGYKMIIVTSGGKLLEAAEKNNYPVMKVPSGIQPRLSSGYFIAGLVKILNNCGLIPNVEQKILDGVMCLGQYLNEDDAKKIAKEIKGNVPIIYATDNNESIARVAKIKFNENAKTQAFYNVFPELNHNEMVGFTNLVMPPFFLILESNLAHERNIKRIEVFKDLMDKKGIPGVVVDMKGESVFEEIMNAYYFIDHVTYYLAEEYGIDPEPVDMVEEFKKMLG